MLKPRCVGWKRHSQQSGSPPSASSRLLHPEDFQQWQQAGPTAENNHPHENTLQFSKDGVLFRKWSENTSTWQSRGESLSPKATPQNNKTCPKCAGKSCYRDTQVRSSLWIHLVLNKNTPSHAQVGEHSFLESFLEGKGLGDVGVLLNLWKLLG